MARPNLLLIVSDQHNPHVLGCGGDARVRTPHLDALAADGVRFTNTYCAAPLCAPSRLCMLSSRHPSDLRLWRNTAVLDEPYLPTFAHQLSLAGYETILCGRMHFEGPDQHHGFERRLVGDMSGARDPSRPLFEDRISIDTTGQTHVSIRDAGPGRTSYMAFDDEVTRRAVQFLEQRGRGGGGGRGGGDRPFCLVVGYVLPHNPYICPRPLFDEYMDALELPATFDQDPAALHPAMQAWRDVRGVGRLTREQHRRARAAYYGLVTYMDQRIGRVLAALAQSGEADRTAVAYVSDHGDLAGEHGLWWKESFYEGSVAVPMIWSWPSRFARGATSAALTGLIDLAPTCLDLAGAPMLPGTRGETLVPLLDPADRRTRRTEAVFSEMYPVDLMPARMIRQGRWKLATYHGYPMPQLFDLSADPDERRDLGGEGLPAAAELLERVLAGWSGDQVRQITAQRQEAARILRDWHERVRPGESERWSVPPDSNALDG